VGEIPSSRDSALNVATLAQPAAAPASFACRARHATRRIRMAAAANSWAKWAGISSSSMEEVAADSSNNLS